MPDTSRFDVLTLDESDRIQDVRGFLDTRRHDGAARVRDRSPDG
jgi:hypothetical protein